jgi:hypothetical protein
MADDIEDDVEDTSYEDEDEGVLPEQVSDTGGMGDDDFEGGELPDPEAASNPEVTRAAVQGGMSYINKAFGFDRPSAGAVDTGEPDQFKQASYQALAQNRGAMPARELREIKDTIDPEGRLSASERTIGALNLTYDYYVRNGDVKKAQQTSAAMLMAGRRALQIAGQSAEGALARGDTETAAKLIQQGFDLNPTGNNFRIGKMTPKGMEYEILQNGKTVEAGYADPAKMKVLSRQMIDGTAWAQDVGAAATGGKGQMTEYQREQLKRAQARDARTEGRESKKDEFYRRREERQAKLDARREELDRLRIEKEKRTLDGTLPGRAGTRGARGSGDPDDTGAPDDKTIEQIDAEITKHNKSGVEIKPTAMNHLRIATHDIVEKNKTTVQEGAHIATLLAAGKGKPIDPKDPVGKGFEVPGYGTVLLTPRAINRFALMEPVKPAAPAPGTGTPVVGTMKPTVAAPMQDLQREQLGPQAPPDPRVAEQKAAAVAQALEQAKRELGPYYRPGMTPAEINAALDQKRQADMIRNPTPPGGPYRAYDGRR